MQAQSEKNTRTDSNVPKKGINLGASNYGGYIVVKLSHKKVASDWQSQFMSRSKLLNGEVTSVLGQIRIIHGDVTLLLENDKGISMQTWQTKRKDA